jgi:hypothetical protein
MFSMCSRTVVCMVKNLYELLCAFAVKKDPIPSSRINYCFPEVNSSREAGGLGDLLTPG